MRRTRFLRAPNPGLGDLNAPSGRASSVAVIATSPVPIPEMAATAPVAAGLHAAAAEPAQANAATVPITADDAATTDARAASAPST